MSEFVTYDWEAGKPKRTAANVTLPPKTFEKDGLRIVDLTKVIDPSTESRRCNLWRFNTGGAVPDFHTNVDIGSHLGTHCECPYHHDSNWPSVAELPVSQFMGRGIYVKLDLPADHIITAEDLDKALGKKIRPHDTVILDSLDESLRIPPFTSLTGSDRDHRLQVGAEHPHPSVAVHLTVDRVGIDVERLHTHRVGVHIDRVLLRIVLDQGAARGKALAGLLVVDNFTGGELVLVLLVHEDDIAQAVVVARIAIII